jgi:hypothetical protein
MVRDRAGRFKPELGDVTTLTECLRGHEPMTVAKLDFHVTTLFPPLQPRGFLEIRSLDALGTACRSAAIGAVWALLADSSVSDAGLTHATSADEVACSCHGLDNEAAVQRSAAAMFELASESLAEAAPDLGCGKTTFPVVVGGANRLTTQPYILVCRHCTFSKSESSV